MNNEYENDETEENKVASNLRTTMYSIFLLAFFRILALQFLLMINDIIATLIIYCTYSTRGRLMAIFCIINGVLGVIYAILIGTNDINRMKDDPNPNGFINFMLVFTMFYAIIAYSMITYYSYKAYKTFRNPFGRIPEEDYNNDMYPQNRNNYQGNDYGGIENRGNSNVYGLNHNPGGTSATQHSNRDFVPFRGRGIQLGGN
jgi:hypothetical protein